MKVCLLAPTPPPVGGIAGWTVRMLAAELKNGWTVEVVDEKLTGKRTGFGGRSKPVFSDEVIRCFRIWRQLWRKLRDGDVKVVHACIPASSTAMAREIVSGVITKMHRRKFITHFRCTVPNMVKSRLGRYMLKLLCDLSDCVMLLNKQSEVFVAALTKTRIEVIPNFVEETELEQSHEIRNQITQVVYVGGVIESKGALDLVEVAKGFPDINFRLVGKANARCQEAAHAVGNVTLVGLLSRNEVREELRNADVFAFLSYFPGEGFSNALAEAMAAGLPCLVTKWAANQDMVGEAGGFVVDIRSPEQAIQALKKMLPQQVRKNQSVSNIMKVKNCYRAEIVLGMYVDCYERCLL